MAPISVRSNSKSKAASEQNPIQIGQKSSARAVANNPIKGAYDA